MRLELSTNLERAHLNLNPDWRVVRLLCAVLLDRELLRFEEEEDLEFDPSNTSKTEMSNAQQLNT